MDASSLEVWGGVECTVCRTGERYIDQTRLTGHHDREDDLDRIASLGISKLRYPVVWERVAPKGVASADWEWTDARLERLHKLGITPVVTLLHHGSGPSYTNLLDPEFPEKFAAYASAVARRYPWLRYFTPVNEPTTTARFSALYGWWYPHEKNDTAFYTALFNQLRATRKAMDAIREHIPQAQFVSTEDLGYTYATPPLEYQARHENARRLLAGDLLCGTLEANPLMAVHLRKLGFAVGKRFERSMYCPPDIMGFNYYVTGERWIDHRLDRYPAHLAGGNGVHRYVDVEAVRACVEGLAGPAALLSECADRYARPVAITEAHLACTVDEQVRWLRDIYTDVLALRRDGTDVRAFTAWCLLGAYNWNSMCTRDDGYYESGAFDVSSGIARETGVATYIRALTGKSAARPRLYEGAGWWKRLQTRLLFMPCERAWERAS